MKISLLIALLFFLATAGGLRAEDKNGYRVTVQKTTLARDDVRGPGYFDDMIDRTLGLKAAIKNIGMKDKAEATVEYVIIVSRWAYSPPRYEKYSGKESLPVLKPQDEKELTLGKARLGGYANYANKKYQDKIEAWQITVQENGAAAVVVQSGSSFDRMAARAQRPSSH